MEDLICEDWVLYDTEYFGIVRKESYLGKHYSELATQNKSLRVFGTRNQILKYSIDFNIDESYKYEIEKIGSYWYNHITDVIHYNSIVSKNLKKYREMYIKNDNKIVVLI